MRPSIWRQGLAAPAIVGVVTLAVWAAAGAAWALGVLAIGAGAIIVGHLRNIQRAIDWAHGPLDAPVPDARGVWVEFFAGLHRRTRLRIAMHREVKQVLERFRRAADAIPDGVLVLDAMNRIEWANPRAIEQLSLNMETDRGQPLMNLLRAPEFVSYVEAGDFNDSVLVQRPHERRTLSLQLVPFGLRDKLLLSRDVTQIEAVARMRRDFIANVSHELKTPLTVIAGFVETLLDVDFEPRQRARYLGLMQDQARNMQRLVEDLLTLSTLEAEHNPVNDQTFAIVPLLLEVSADTKALSRGEHTVSLDIGEAADIAGNRDELRSAFGNLVSNAVRYTPQGGSITLAWRIEEGGDGVFAVTDTGIGVAAEHIPRLTERFYRVDRSRSRATGGTGLGLAIVKHVMIRHQAELEIKSAPGQGSTFAVRLPAKRVRRAVTASTAANEEASPGPVQGDATNAAGAR